MLFFLPVLALYFQKDLFTVANVSIIFAVEALASVLFEIPTGAMADIFGRKKTIIVSQAILICAIFFLYLGGNIAMFIIYAILNAFSASLASGTDEAIIYDSLQEENKESYFKKIIGIYGSLWPLGASIGSIIGGYIAKVSLQSTVSISFIPVVIALILTSFLREPFYKKEDHKNILRHMGNAIGVIMRNKQLIILAIASFIMMALGESAHLLTPIFLKFKGIDIEYFGWITALSFGLSSAGFYFSHGVAEKIGDKGSLILTTTLAPIFILIATLLHGFSLVIFFVVAAIFFGIRNPILGHLMNTNIVSSKRATVISINNFIGKLGLVITMPLFGYFAGIYTISVAIQASAMCLLTVPLLFLLLNTTD
ncbi:hypothetical protein A2524_01500 [Candidatus Wolfebacteria bacterium RIFOXYD12_FULL_48_21]|uniref:Major facilitator superfamily (MFS) profile domain-containing protein n=1 Tax=Candidatus Wolfebacteria bacterium RIFOXYD1_FULL_48_65 TaxID=1802561 RepID=A0A1F8E5Y4_9BACT|nr:MAG: hypothetical protein A2524_01500 [Candidatus Wolfebacteria bacterium RIFOXYD12_FULL_48_21]OGM95586.1 MAG: hypothetical protein A2532_00930 [Candidatus Wolfebacteria bacterium RIFOXYD2_FULL_48_11]OGM95598.1 MAG: hypothetical protein A2610_00650 [Candidatus Wolfebacteria bacterium RIFOXYD1_FULL_48_65]